MIALLIAFSLVALGTCLGVALGATARADVQRRLSEIGLMRAVGLTRLAVAGRYSLDALLIALPATRHRLVPRLRPASRLLSILSEMPPGAALLLPLLGCLLLILALVVGATVSARVAGGRSVSGGDPSRRRAAGKRPPHPRARRAVRALASASRARAAV